MSTQDLLLMIEAAVKAGETEFDIAASGQHDIGGPLWHPDGRTLKFHVTNDGQHVGSMCLPNTEIICEIFCAVSIFSARLAFRLNSDWLSCVKAKLMRRCGSC